VRQGQLIEISRVSYIILLEIRTNSIDFPYSHKADRFHQINYLEYIFIVVQIILDVIMWDPTKTEASAENTRGIE